MIKREELEEYVKVSRERKEHDRKSKALKAREEAILELAHAELKAAGRNQIIRFGYGLCLEAGRANVPWKESYIVLAGATAAAKLAEDAANEAAKQENLKPKIVPPVS